MDGDKRSTVRPLRPAAPPDGVAGSPAIPRPRRTAAPPSPEVTAPAEPTGTGAGPTAGEAASTDESTKVDPAVTPADAKAGAGDTGSGKDVPAGGRRRRIPFSHAVRVPPPRQLAVGAARATRAWSRRPSGRTTLPGLFLLALVAATAAAGALLVPSAVRRPQPVAVDATASVSVSGVPEGGVVPGLPPGQTGLPGDPLATATPLPGGVQPTGPVAGPGTGRPADALAEWAAQVNAKTKIPVVALQAYGYAERVLEQTHRGCQLSWTTLAAIGYVESAHGGFKATLGPDGVARPEILGPPLDGQGGTSRILDTDKGQLDHDTVYDRALGPMQFIPSTWQQVGADADNDGVRNPHDIDDAALAAGNYLCQGGRNMTIAGDWWGAILSYNDVRRYAKDIFDKANEYGRLSRT